MTRASVLFLTYGSDDGPFSEALSNISSVEFDLE